MVTEKPVAIEEEFQFRNGDKVDVFEKAEEFDTTTVDKYGYVTKKSQIVPEFSQQQMRTAAQKAENVVQGERNAEAVATAVARAEEAALAAEIQAREIEAKIAYANEVARERRYGSTNLIQRAQQYNTAKSVENAATAVRNVDTAVAAVDTVDAIKQEETAVYDEEVAREYETAGFMNARRGNRLAAAYDAEEANIYETDAVRHEAKAFADERAAGAAVGGAVNAERVRRGARAVEDRALWGY